MKRTMRFLLPDQSVPSFDQLDIRSLKEQGIQILFVDIDNTISAYADTACSLSASRFLKRVKAAGIEPVLFTNNTKKHVDTVLAGRPDTDLMTFCLKPSPVALLRALRVRKLHPSQAAVLGDQLFTDMLCGRLAGARTILCGRVSQVERRDTSIMRFFENLAYTRMEKQGKIERRDGYVRIL